MKATYYGKGWLTRFEPEIEGAMVKGQIYRGDISIGSFEFVEGRLTVLCRDYWVKELTRELTEKGIGHMTGGLLEDGTLWDGMAYMPLKGDDDFGAAERKFRMRGFKLKVEERS